MTGSESVWGSAWDQDSDQSSDDDECLLPPKDPQAPTNLPNSLCEAIQALRKEDADSIEGALQV